MRTFYFTLSILSSFGTFGQSAYQVFPDSNVYWCEFYYYASQQLYQTCNTLYFYKGDTLLDGKSHRKLMQSKSCNTGGNSYNQYKGAIWQDSINKKVYICLPNASRDTLLYSFDLQAGDTIQNTYTSAGYQYSVVNVDSILIGNTYRNRYNISWLGGSTIETSLIEGIGNTNGLLSPYSWGLFQGGQISCFELDDSFVYYTVSDTVNNCCGGLKGVGTETNSSPRILCYPNPASDGILVEVSTGQEVILKLVDANGQERMNIQFFSTITIELTDMESGVYCAKIFSGDKILTRKIVVQH